MKHAKDQFYSLTPDHVLQGVEAAGFLCTGEYIQLNSYENRVFDLKLEDNGQHPELNQRVIAKYYRPLRWSFEALKDEHDFLTELNGAGIPAVAPLKLENDKTISQLGSIYLSLFPKIWGRLPQELSAEDFKSVGRTLARIHNVGEQRVAKHRPILGTETYGWPILDLLADWVAPEVWTRYEKAAEDILDYLDEFLDETKFIRIHGDCHKGNLLRTDIAGQPREFLFVDFDDFCNGPPAQDFWMLFSGDEKESAWEVDQILAGYDELRNFPLKDLDLTMALRGLRIIHYAGWIARRWEDPSFPQIFPQFEDYSYWAEETEALEKIAWSL